MTKTAVIDKATTEEKSKTRSGMNKQKVERKDIINPRVDLVFKKLFGVEENKDLLISLINSIVSEEDQVASVELINPYNLQDFKDDKLSVLDIKAKAKTGRRYQIEMQVTDEGDYDKRALFCWAELYTEQLKQGKDYSQLNKAIGIHILNFTCLDSVEKYHNVFHLREKDSGLHYFKDIELHTIELDKFEKTRGGTSLSETEQLERMISKIKTSLDRWVAFLTRHDLLDKNRLPKPIATKELKKALEVLEVMRLSEEEREAYRTHLSWLRQEVSAIKKAEAKGIAKGVAKGIAEEAARGEVKVKEAKEEFAKKLLARGYDTKEITELTGFTAVELKKLKD